MPPKNSVVPAKQELTGFLVLGQNRYSAGMSALQNLVRNAYQAFQFIGQLLKYAVTFLLALVQPRAVLAARLLAEQSQLAVCKHRIQERKDPRPRFTAGFRVLWVVLSKFLKTWQDCAHLMQPATVKRWHTTAFRMYWRWKSRGKPVSPCDRHVITDAVARISLLKRDGLAQRDVP